MSPWLKWLWSGLDTTMEKIRCLKGRSQGIFLFNFFIYIPRKSSRDSIKNAKKLHCAIKLLQIICKKKSAARIVNKNVNLKENNMTEPSINGQKTINRKMAEIRFNDGRNPNRYFNNEFSYKAVKVGFFFFNFI